MKGQHHQNVCKPYHVGSLWCNCLKWGWSANHTHQEKTRPTPGAFKRGVAPHSQTPGPGLEQRVIGCDLPLGKRLPFGNNDSKSQKGEKQLVLQNGDWFAITISIGTFKPGSETRSESNLVTVLTSMTIFGKYICLAGQGKFGWNWCHRKTPQMFSWQPELHCEQLKHKNWIMISWKGPSISTKLSQTKTCHSPQIRSSSLSASGRPQHQT